MKLIILVAAIASVVLAEELTIQNNCGRDIYVKSEGVNSGPFMLGNGRSSTVSINRGPSSRVWAHTGCDGNGQNCETTEGYVSLAEMHWSDDGATWYDVSQVDGYNLPVRMEPYDASVGGNCRPASCSFNIDGDCPNENKIFYGGRAVACRNPNRDAVTSYSQAMKRACPGVYSWSHDAEDVMRDCRPGNRGLRITFC